MSKGAAAGDSSACEVLKSGREVDQILHSLLRHANDADEAVRAQISFAVHDLGLQQPLLAVSSLVAFMQRNAKLEQSHRVILLRQLAALLETHTAQEAVAATEKSAVPAQAALVGAAIKFCAKEMTSAAVRTAQTKRNSRTRHLQLQCKSLALAFPPRPCTLAR